METDAVSSTLTIPAHRHLNVIVPRVPMRYKSYEWPAVTQPPRPIPLNREARMAFLEYMLVGLLGTAAVSPGGAPARTFTAEAVTQPSGGTEGLLGQNRHHKKPANRAGARKYARLGRRYPIYPSTGNVGGVKRSANQQPPPKRPRAAPSNANKNSK